MAPRGVEAGGHVAGYATVELVAGDATQLREGCLAVGANIDIGKSRVEGNGLVRIEVELPDTRLMFDGIEHVGSLQGRHARHGIKGERNIT
jgi:hypothetical protein